MLARKPHERSRYLEQNNRCWWKIPGHIKRETGPGYKKFSRVVFGITSSPFQVQFVIQKHAQLHRSEYPMASEIALKSTYMGDSIDSVQDEEKGIQLCHQLAALWNKAGMRACTQVAL